MLKVGTDNEVASKDLHSETQVREGNLVATREKRVLAPSVLTFENHCDKNFGKRMMIDGLLPVSWHMAVLVADSL